MKKRPFKERYPTLRSFLKGDGPCHYIGDRYIEDTNIYDRREWRGVADTAYDFGWWLATWLKMGAFVAKNPEFIQMAKDAVRLVAEQNPADVAALGELALGDKTLEAVRTALVGKIGENMTFRRFTRVEAKGLLSSYVHGSKIGVIVDVTGGADEVAHDIAMHIAASKPKALNEEGIAAEAIETERRVAIEKAREAGKPEAMLERIAEGSVKKFLKEVTLLNQPFVKDDKKTVGELLKQNDAVANAYTLYVVGEGLEKRNDDFAAEVAAQVAAAKQA